MEMVEVDDETSCCLLPMLDARVLFGVSTTSSRDPTVNVDLLSLTLPVDVDEAVDEVDDEVDV